MVNRTYVPCQGQKHTLVLFAQSQFPLPPYWADSLPGSR
jgi:hypothetical protein